MKPAISKTLTTRTIQAFVALLCISTLASGALSQQSSPSLEQTGFEPILNGKDLTGWAGAVDDYEVVEGAIVCKKGRGGVLFTKQQYADFVVRLEFQMPAGGNNGLAIRYPGTGRASYDGMCELQVLDDDAEKYKDLDSRQYHGSIYGIVAAKRGSLKPVGEWNSQQVSVIGSRIKVELNGTTIVDADVSQVDKYLDDKPHPGKDLTQGHFGFAGHGDPVKFRNILVKQVKAAAPVTEESNLATLKKHLTFLASFDQGFDADIGPADKRIRTAEDLERKKSSPGMHIDAVKIAANQGRHGGAIHFEKKTPQSLFYSGASIGYRKENWSGTASAWMKLDANEDLLPGYCDPLLISDKQWDKAAFFIDFDKDLPRDFRLGVFPDFEVWNPSNTPWEKIAVADRPMVVVKKPPFARDKWTHICFTWEGANHPEGVPGRASLYVNGVLQGTNSQNLKYSWQADQAAIMLGIYYIGLMDEIATFDRALNAQQVKLLYELPKGLAGM
jgi:Domain of Unknown Function (DUF1080)/Concanavalin A-like lectin/glucanases superfamily